MSGDQLEVASSGGGQGAGEEIAEGTERCLVALSWATQRGHLSAVMPRIPPYSVLQWLHRNMALAYPIGDLPETLSPLWLVPTFLVLGGFGEWALCGQYPVPVFTCLRSAGWAPPFFSSVEQAWAMSSASRSTCSRLSVSLTSARRTLTFSALGGSV